MCFPSFKMEWLCCPCLIKGKCCVHPCYEEEWLCFPSSQGGMVVFPFSAHRKRNTALLRETAIIPVLREEATILLDNRRSNHPPYREKKKPLSLTRGKRQVPCCEKKQPLSLLREETPLLRMENTTPLPVEQVASLKKANGCSFSRQ